MLQRLLLLDDWICEFTCCFIGEVGIVVVVSLFLMCLRESSDWIKQDFSIRANPSALHYA